MNWMNKKHHQIFEMIKSLLSIHFGADLQEYEDGTLISIGETGIWISSDEMELTVGYGINHRHYLSEKEFLIEAINDFFNLLTKKKKVTEFYKGTNTYKIKTEIEQSIREYSELSTSSTLLFPFWKKTHKKIIIEEEILEYSKIEKEISEIKNYAQQFL